MESLPSLFPNCFPSPTSTSTSLPLPFPCVSIGRSGAGSTAAFIGAGDARAHLALSASFPRVLFVGTATVVAARAEQGCEGEAAAQRRQLRSTRPPSAKGEFRSIDACVSTVIL